MRVKYIASFFVIGLVVGGGGVYLWVQQNNIAEISRIKDFSKVVDDNRVIYTNEQYGFSLHYPKGLIFQEFDEGGGSWTIVFQKPGDAKLGFQIYITPYTESTITGDRILLDVQSGSVSNLIEEQLTEDMLVATFVNTDPFLGEIREIWFLHSGHLYEVTSYLELDEMLREVVKSIKFR